MNSSDYKIPNIVRHAVNVMCIYAWTNSSPLYKMAAIDADDTFNSIFLKENNRIPIQISLKYVSRSPIDNKTALVRVVAWRRTGDKPLPGQMVTQFIDAYMPHNSGSFLWHCLAIWLPIAFSVTCVITIRSHYIIVMIFCIFITNSWDSSFS